MEDEAVRKQAEMESTLDAALAANAEAETARMTASEELQTKHASEVDDIKLKHEQENQER